MFPALAHALIKAMATARLDEDSIELLTHANKTMYETVAWAMKKLLC